MNYVTEKNNEYSSNSVFVDIFANDIKAKENCLSIYNTLHNKNLDISNTQIDIFNLEDNVISCVTNETVIIFTEYKSIPSDDIVFKFLVYISKLYEKLLDYKMYYAKNLIKIPTPKFYIFYRGKEDYPEEYDLNISNNFIIDKKENNDTNLKMIVKVININSNKHNKILEKCSILYEYTQFIETVQKCIKDNEENGFTKAIQICIEKGILKDYVSRKNKEIISILQNEYN